MHRLLIVILGTALAWSQVVESGYAQSGTSVADSPHNLRKATRGSMADLGLQDYGDVCVYCHAEHDPSSDLRTPLLNRILPSTVFQMYDGQRLTVAVAASPDSTSLACLSCHDGTMALDAVQQGPITHLDAATGKVTIASCEKECHTASNPSGGIIFAGGNVGSDLRNHHPIGIPYDHGKNPDLHAPSNGKVNGLPLYGPDRNQVGCGSCHDPHDDSQRPFLRVSGLDGALCLACHKT